MPSPEAESFRNLFNSPGGLQKVQRAWTDYGLAAQKALAAAPESFLIRNSPYSEWIWNQALLEALDPLDGKKVIELGCGLGKFSVYLAKKGATVHGIDISREAVNTAIQIAHINQVECGFRVGDITTLPFDEVEFDLAVGVAILHHLSKPDVKTSLAEVHRILKPGGKAVFLEPIENNPIFSFLQNLIPAGRKSSGYYRPSILSRRQWQKYLAQMEDRDLTTREILEAGAVFRKVWVRGFGLTSRFDRLIEKPEWVATLHRIDTICFNLVPFLENYARNVLAVFLKT